jgi:hypothetical protein
MVKIENADGFASKVGFKQPPKSPSPITDKDDLLSGQTFKFDLG